MVIAKRKAVDRFRKSSVNRDVKLLDNEEEYIDLPDDFNLEDEFQQREIRKKLISIIKVLVSRIQQLLFTGFIFWGKFKGNCSGYRT